MNPPKQACWMLRKVFDARGWLTSQGHLQYPLLAMTDRNGFSIKKGYLAMMPRYQKAEWNRVVLTKGLISRHKFILWLALQRKLSTVERMITWGIQVQTDCVLCATQLEENFNHLFF